MNSLPAQFKKRGFKLDKKDPFDTYQVSQEELDKKPKPFPNWRGSVEGKPVVPPAEGRSDRSTPLGLKAVALGSNTWVAGNISDSSQNAEQTPQEPMNSAEVTKDALAKSAKSVEKRSEQEEDYSDPRKYTRSDEGSSTRRGQLDKPAVWVIWQGARIRIRPSAAWYQATTGNMPGWLVWLFDTTEYPDGPDWVPPMLDLESPNPTPQAFKVILGDVTYECHHINVELTIPIDNGYSMMVFQADRV